MEEVTTTSEESAPISAEVDLGQDLGIMDDAAFQGEETVAPPPPVKKAEGEPAPAPESDADSEAETGTEGEVDEEAWYAHLDGLASGVQSPATQVAQAQAQVQAQPPVAQAQPEREWVSQDEFDEMLTDPSKMNETLNKVYRTALNEAREQAMIQMVVPQIEARINNFLNEHPAINTPVMKEQFGKAIMALDRQYPNAPMETILAHAERYVQVYAERNPHRMVRFDKELPPLPGVKKAEPAKRQAPVARPAFPGGGGAARRVVPQARSIDPLQAELDELKPEHAY